MIYTRFGSRVEIAANCGECHPKGFRASLTLLKIRYHGTTGGGNYYFMEFLRATGSWPEIQRAVGAAPSTTLVGKELSEAIKEAKQ